MPIVNLTPLRDTLGGAEMQDAVVHARARRGFGDAIRISGPSVSFARNIVVTFNGGVQSSPLDLPVLPADCYWAITVTPAVGRGLSVNVASPLEDVDFDELIRVEPSSDLPRPGTSLGDAFLSELAAIRDAFLYAANGTLISAPGPQGPAGPKGDQGEPGVAGPVGTKGDAGATGPQGPAGVAGAKGDAGAAGPQGPQGAKGDTGAASTVAGPQGPAGAAGATGPQGPAGAKGDAGVQGPAGPTGATGPAGPTGAASTVAGPAGATGPAGPTGPKGDTGAAGAKGDQGIQGLTGATGPQGPAGTAGAKGDTGAAGAVGPTGPAGSTGPQGVAGPTGANGQSVQTINHGSNGALVRPATSAPVIWVGTVAPAAAIDGDIWLNPSNTSTPTPEIPTGFVHRYEAADITSADGTAATTWSNRVSGSPAFTATGGVAFKNTSGLKSFVFNGTDGRMDAPIASVSQAYTKVVLARYVTAAASKVLIGGSSGSNNIASTSTSKMSMTNGTTLAHTENVNTSWHLFTAVSAGASSQIWVDDAIVTGAGGSSGQLELRLAANGGLTSYSNIEVCMVLVYPRAITPSEYQSILAYAKAVYPGTV